MIGPGSKELILGLQLVCEAELLLPSPSWVSYEPQAHIAQSKVSWIETTEKDKWLLTAETLEEVLSKRSGSPQILLLNYPSNPIGATFSEDQLRDLARVARKYNLTIVADEIYGELTFSGNYSSIAQFYPEGTIISSGLSKWCGAGGWRLGTFTFPKAYRYILDTMATLASESFSAVSAPVQYAAITAFNGSTAIQAYIKNSRKILDVIGHFVHKSLLVNKVSLPAPEGGFYLFPNFEYYRGPLERKGIRTNTDFCESLLEETGIALLPGKAFGRPSTELTCRLSYVDFDGEKALNAAKELGGEKLDEVFIKTICPNMYKSMQVLGNWLKQM
jgi:aspartate aminotransferase